MEVISTEISAVGWMVPSWNVLWIAIGAMMTDATNP
jgi:hypothetical protein